MAIAIGSDGKPIDRIEPEADRAARHKKALAEALEAVRVAAEAARMDGFFVELGLPLDQFGRYVATPIGLIKRF